MKDKILAQAKRSFKAPRGYNGIIRCTAEAYQLGGNEHPHFAVTAEIGTPREFGRGDFQAGGCLHDEIAKVWPAVKPIIALHLSNADDGAPIHGTANGFYDLAGSVPGNFGEQYHRGNSQMHFPKNQNPQGIPAPTAGGPFKLGKVVTVITPHPFHLTNKHLERSRSMTLDADAAPCGYPGCTLKADEHKPEKVLQIVLKERAEDLNAVPGLQDYLVSIKQASETAGISGFAFPTEAQARDTREETDYRTPTHDECLVMLADHLRVSLEDCRTIRDKCVAAFKQGADSVASSPEVSPAAETARRKAGNARAKAIFAEFVETLRPQWKAEAEAGIALIEKLAAENPQASAQNP